MEENLTNFTKQETIITITSFTGIYTFLIYCFSIGYYDSFLLPSIYYSIDSSLLMTNGILLLAIFAMLVLPYMLLGPAALMLNQYITSTKIYNDTKLRVPSKHRRTLLVLIIICVYGLIIFYLYNTATLNTFIIAFLCLVAFYTLFMNKSSRILYYAGILLSVLLLMGGSYYVGNNLAKSAGFYSVTSYKNQDYIIIKEYKEHYVIAPIDFSQNKIDASFQLIPLSTEDIEVRLKSIESIEMKLK